MLKFREGDIISNAGDLLITSQGIAFIHDNKILIGRNQNRKEIVIPPNLKLRFLRERGRYIELVSNYEELYFIDINLIELVKINTAPLEKEHVLYDYYLNNKTFSISIFRRKRLFKIIIYDYEKNIFNSTIENIERIYVLHLDEEKFIFLAKINGAFVVNCFKLTENVLRWSTELQNFSDCDASTRIGIFNNNLVFSINNTHTLSINIETGNINWIADTYINLIDKDTVKAYGFLGEYFNVLDCNTGNLLYSSNNWFDKTQYENAFGLISATACLYKDYIICFSVGTEIFIISKELNTIVGNFTPPFKGRESFTRELMIFENFLYMTDTSETIYEYRLEIV